MLLGHVDEQKEAMNIYLNPPGVLRVFNLQKRGVWAAWLGQFTKFHHNRPFWGYPEDFPGFNMRIPVKLPYAGEHVYIVYMKISDFYM